MNLGDVAKKINGVVVGDSSIEITGVGSIETAGSGHITFAKGKKIIDTLKQSKASAWHEPDHLFQPGASIRQTA